MSLGDTRIQMTITRDSNTAKLGRRTRIMVDDPESPQPLVYRIAKPFKVGGVYGLNGAMSFMLTEVNLDADDDTENMIANYYDYHKSASDREVKPLSQELGKDVWI